MQVIDVGHHPLTTLLDAVDSAADSPPVHVGDVLNEVGERSFSPIILVIALLMVSPLSGIPGSPTVSAVLILLVGAQYPLGRRHMWLPDIMLRREVPAGALRRAVSWMRRPAAWLDRHSEKRWRLLTIPPLRIATMLTCMSVALVWPFLELLPFVTSIGAIGVALLSFGLFTRDGLYVLLGFFFVTLLVATGLRVLSAV